MRTTLIAACFAILAGCSTHLVVTDISDPNVTDIKGIPFRVTTDHVVSIYRLKDDADKYELVSVSTQRLADQRRLYAINFKGDTFATRSLRVAENPDNTLKTVQLTSTDAAGGFIDSLNSTVSGITAANTAKKTAALTNAKAVVDADKAVRDAQKDLDALASTASAETRTIYERILESAKQQAVAARAAAGL